ncbi:Alpha-tubulin N-acetyltransferase 1 [Haplosporangium bisporale]|nr:Alpha-tubulin N-acetyltransferase 1 [Haplosporangium bisporale]
MDFEFPLIPLLPLPITLVPASTFAALEDSKAQSVQNAYVSTVSIGISSTATSASTPSPEALSEHERLGAIVDALGEASAKAQELPTSITQRQRLAKNPTQRVYILRTGFDSGEDQWLDQLQIGSPLMKEAIMKSLLYRNGPSISQESKEDDQDVVQEHTPMIQTRSRSEEKGVYVAGMLKIGEKKLFIVDKSGAMHEQVACCVLDFYVDDSCQRRGYGKLLFDYMLKVEDVEPNQIAYDRPSPKLYQFLSKHFGLDRHLPQPNQFAIFEGYMLQDCGEPIMVDDQPYPSTSNYSSSSRSSPSKLSFDPFSSPPSQQHHTNTSSSQTIPSSHSLSADNATLDHNDSFHNIKGSIPSRAKQSSTVLDGLSNRSTTNATTPSTTTGSTNRRISSAFTSSINLSSPATNNTNSTSSGIPFHPGTAPSPALPSGGGTGRTSRLLVSSIVFADS